MEKIKVEKINIKKQADSYTILEITTPEGKKLDTFDDLKEGQEYTGNITPNANPKFNPSFKLEKDKKKFTPRAEAINILTKRAIERGVGIF